MPSERTWLLPLLLVLAPSLQATTPLAIPEWASLELAPRKGLELGRPADWTLTVEARVGAVFASPPMIEIGPGVEVLSPPVPEGAQWSRPGQPARWSFRVRLSGSPPVLSARVPATCPLEALEGEAQRLYRDSAPHALEAVLERIRSLPRKQELFLRSRPHALPEEGSLEGKGPVYTRYLQAGPGRFAVWDPPARKGTGAARRALATASPALRRLLLQSGVQEGPPEPRSRYRELLAEVSRGSKRAGLPGDLRDLVRDCQNAPEVLGATLNLLAFAALAGGDRATAEQVWRRLGAGEGPRHYFHFNLGELLRVSGKKLEATREFARALELRPVFTLARSRLASE